MPRGVGPHETEPDPEHQREKHHREDVAVGGGADGIVGNDPEDELHPRSLAGGRRDRRRPRCCPLEHPRLGLGGEPAPRLQRIDEEDAEEDRDRRDGQRVEKRLEADPPEAPEIPQPRHPQHEGREDQGDDEHEEEAQEDLAGRLRDVLDEAREPGGAAEEHARPDARADSRGETRHHAEVEPGVRSGGGSR